MTETFSLLVYVLVLYWSLAYLRDRRLWQLAVVQALSVLLIGIRMSYLLLVQACTILLPLIAFARCALPVFRKRSEAPAPESRLLATGLTHVIASVAMNAGAKLKKTLERAIALRERPPSMRCCGGRCNSRARCENLHGILERCIPSLVRPIRSWLWQVARQPSQDACRQVRISNGKPPPSAVLLIVTSVLSLGLAVLLHCGRVAFSLRVRYLVGARPSVWLSLVCARIDPDGGDNGSLTAGMRSLPPTRLCFDALEHCHLC
jgi:hypothetical protein